MLDVDLTNPETWHPNMVPPSIVDVAAYQSRIDNLVGTSKGKSIIKLAWAPDEKRWRPFRIGFDKPTGYTFPIFFAFKDRLGNEIAAPRWVLLERAEPEEYGPSWEQSRYMVIKNQVWDCKGECPPERYTELWRHCDHDGKCCPCRGAICDCEVDCWGRYLEPNDQLLARIGSWVETTEGDSDIQPHSDARYTETPNAQRAVARRILKRDEVEKRERDQRKKDSRHSIETSPVHFLPPSGMTRTESGLFIPNN